ncbi:MAG: PilZ domain-containing protein [Planctomycetota bacterium]
MDKPNPVANQAFKSILKNLTVGNPNRRDSDRVPWRSSVELHPLDADFNPAGEKLKAFSSDISRKGIGLISPLPVEHEFVKIVVPDAELSLYGRVMHTTNIGDEWPQFLVGIQFLT